MVGENGDGTVVCAVCEETAEESVAGTSAESPAGDETPIDDADANLEAIAFEHLGIPSLADRHHLPYQVSARHVRRALGAAFEAGRHARPRGDRGR